MKESFGIDIWEMVQNNIREMYRARCERIPYTRIYDNHPIRVYQRKLMYHG